MNCPNCMHLLDAATCVSDNEAKQPEAGDATVCLYCGRILIYIEDGLRAASVADLRAMPVELLIVLSQAQAFVGIAHIQDHRPGNLN